MLNANTDVSTYDLAEPVLSRQRYRQVLRKVHRDLNRAANHRAVFFAGAGDSEPQRSTSHPAFISELAFARLMDRSMR